MADRSNIEWCDSTFNPWVGCTKVSPACDHCYAEAMMSTRLGRVEWGAGKPRQRTSVANWRKPLQWNAKPFWQCSACNHRGEDKRGGAPEIRRPVLCPACGHNTLKLARRRVFCASLADVFDNDVDIDWRVDLLNLIYETPAIDWLLLTKRIGNVTRMLETAAHRARMHSRFGLAEWLFAWLGGTPPVNVWLGATICDQNEADRDIAKLLATHAAVRFLSIEPMLGPINCADIDEGGVGEETIPREYWTDVDDDDSPPALALNSLTGERWQRFGEWSEDGPRIDWIIVGGESGPHARPMHPDWVRSLRDQCDAAGVAFLFKQWGEHLPEFDRDRDDPDWRVCDEWARKPGRWINAAGGQGFHGDRVHYAHRVGKKATGRMLDGVEHNGFPRVTP